MEKNHGRALLQLELSELLRADRETWFTEPAKIVVGPDGNPTISPAWIAMKERRRQIERLRLQLSAGPQARRE